MCCRPTQLIHDRIFVTALIYTHFIHLVAKVGDSRAVLGTAQFQTQRISAQKTKFDYGIASLSPEVRDLTISPPYEALTERTSQTGIVAFSIYLVTSKSRLLRQLQYCSFLYSDHVKENTSGEG